MNVPILAGCSALGALLALPVLPVLPRGATHPAHPPAGQEAAGLAQRMTALERRVLALEASSRRRPLQDPAGGTGPAPEEATLARAQVRLQGAAAALEQAREDLATFRRQRDVIDPQREVEALLEARHGIDRRLLESELEEGRLKASSLELVDALERTPQVLEVVIPAELTPNPLKAQLYGQMLVVEGDVNRLALDTTGGQAVRQRLEGILLDQLAKLRQRYDSEPAIVEALPRRTETTPNGEYAALGRELSGLRAGIEGQRELRRRLEELRARQEARLDELLGLGAELARLERSLADAERRYEHAFDALLEAER